MKTINNPFITYGYKGSRYFCDRENESRQLIEALQNERNVTLIAPRRVGKTGLIKHVFDQIARQDKHAKCFYIDIFATKNLEQMVQLMARNILGRLDTTSQSALKRLQAFFGSLRPTVSFDQLTGLPTVSLDIRPNEEAQTLKRIFDYMQQSNHRCYVAIDEFQQILSYNHQGIEATLRSYIQFLPNVYFIFAGSMQHLMEEMFTSANRPFFQSSQIMLLRNVPAEKYLSFANRFLKAQKRTISKADFDYLYHKVDGITWYVQAILNRAYQYQETAISADFIDKIIYELVNEQESVYENYYASMTEIQAKLIAAVAKEDIVAAPLAHEFIAKYGLKATSSVRTALNALIDRQFIYRKPEGYMVYDRFFGLWLARL